MSSTFWKKILPPGFKFVPDDSELLLHYLLPKVKGGAIPLGIIHEANVYECNPSQLQGLLDAEENEFTYFFTKRRAKYGNGLRTDRSTMDAQGYWKITSKITIITAKDNANMQLGKKNTLVYYEKPAQGKALVKSNWIMHEYELAETLFTSPQQPQNKQCFNDFVLCRIYKRGKVEAVLSAKRKFESSETIEDAAKMLNEHEETAGAVDQTHFTAENARTKMMVVTGENYINYSDLASDQLWEPFLTSMPLMTLGQLLP